jgi:hypothetical protein
MLGSFDLKFVWLDIHDLTIMCSFYPLRSMSTLKSLSLRYYGNIYGFLKINVHLQTHPQESG